MKLFIVTQWGNNDDPEGPNAVYNTALLVRAHSLDEAVKCAEEVLRKLPHDRVKPEAEHVIEIGTDRGDCEVPLVLLGPVLVSQFSDRGYLSCWQRNYGPAEWTEVEISSKLPRKER
jgi:hypothetical protein